MGKYNFDEIIERKHTNCNRWSFIPKEDSDLIPMTLADMDFKAPPEVIEALAKRVEHGIFGYTRMVDEDYDIILHWIKARHGQVVPREWLLPGPGVVYTMRAAQYVMTKPGDKIVVCPPVHPPFFTTASCFGRQMVSVPLLCDENNYYTMDFAGIEKAFADGARLMLICSPVNPTGRVWTRTELETLSELCIRYDVYLISDEIHRDILLPGFKFTPFTSIPGMAERTVEVISPSKTFNVGGFHTSTAIVANEKIREGIRRRLEDFGHAPGRPTLMSILAQRTGYQYGEEWLDELCEYIDGNFDLALDILKDTPFKAIKPEGTYMLWADCSFLNGNHDELWDYFYKVARVATDTSVAYVRPDYETYKGKLTHVRFLMGMPRPLLQEAMERIREAVLKEPGIR